jgi:hypothetical protein
MAEDYTYEQPAMIAVRGADLDALRQRVGEANQYALGMEAAANEQRERVQVLERENAELRAKLDAVPVNELLFWRNPMGSVLTFERVDAAWGTISAWLDAQAVNP